MIEMGLPNREVRGDHGLNPLFHLIDSRPHDPPRLINLLQAKGHTPPVLGSAHSFYMNPMSHVVLDHSRLR